MTSRILPRYPVYVPSKGRHEYPHTIRCLQKWDVPFYVVAEPREADAYRSVVGDSGEVLVLPDNDVGLIGARNWIKNHAIDAGAIRHWQLDDNMPYFRRLYRGKRIQCPAGVALRVVEDFTDRYDRVALSGPAYTMFVTSTTPRPFNVNVHVYSCTLVLNEIPHQWRLRYNDDTDLCLQVLADGWYTILVQAFQVHKLPTMRVPGGNTDDLYQGDGRLVMARSLERMWPGVVTTDRRFQRPQHVVNWAKFKQPLIRKSDVDLSALPPVDEYGLRLEVIRAPESGALQEWIDTNVPAPSPSL